MREIKNLVVHCADTPNDRDVTAAEIHDWHVAKGWDGIGYSAVIRRDGTIEHGRPDYWVPSQARGHNARSLGVCLVGRDQFTEAQYASLIDWITDKLTLYPQAKVYGHRDFDPGKSCPNFDAKAWWAHNGQV